MAIISFLTFALSPAFLSLLTPFFDDLSLVPSAASLGTFLQFPSPFPMLLAPFPIAAFPSNCAVFWVCPGRSCNLTPFKCTTPEVDVCPLFSFWSCLVQSFVIAGDGVSPFRGTMYTLRPSGLSTLTMRTFEGVVGSFVRSCATTFSFGEYTLAGDCPTCLFTGVTLLLFANIVRSSLSLMALVVPPLDFCVGLDFRVLGLALLFSSPLEEPASSPKDNVLMWDRSSSSDRTISFLSFGVCCTLAFTTAVFWFPRFWQIPNEVLPMAVVVHSCSWWPISGALETTIFGNGLLVGHSTTLVEVPCTLCTLEEGPPSDACTPVPSLVSLSTTSEGFWDVRSWVSGEQFSLGGSVESGWLEAVSTHSSEESSSPVK